MTTSKRVRAYLAKTTNIPSAKELAIKFNCSLPMAYKLLKEHKEGLKAVAEQLPAAKTEEELKKALTSWNMVEDTVVELELDDRVNHPPHYKAGGIETIDFIEAKGLQHNYYLANAIKYISRAPFKGEYLTDLQKAVWYLQREIRCSAEPLKEAA